MSCKNFNYKCSDFFRKGEHVFLIFCMVCESSSSVHRPLESQDHIQLKVVIVH